MLTNLNIAVSGAVKEFLVDSHISYPEKVTVIYNGIKPIKEEARVLDDPKEIRLATVGTLNRQKGMQYLIRALPKIIKEFPEVSLEIIGEGTYKRKLQQEVKKLKLKNKVKFVGFIHDVPKYLAKFDIYIQPSLSESFGLAIVQAMGVGLPIVATNTGGIPEVVTDGKSGILVEPAEVKTLSESIIYLIRNPKKARQMGKFAHDEAELRFNLTDMISKLEQTYEEIAENPTFD